MLWPPTHATIVTPLAMEFVQRATGQEGRRATSTRLVTHRPALRVAGVGNAGLVAESEKSRWAVRAIKTTA